MNELGTTAVQEALETAWVGRPYHYFPSVSSTNDLLKEQVHSAPSGALPAGTVFLAEYQEKGRGRLARQWEAPPGTSLLFSVLFRPSWEPDRLAWLPMLAGLAVARAVEELTGIPIGLKWPNDVVLEQEGVWRKFCGMLLESGVAQDSGRPFVIAGIGVNVNLAAAQLPPAHFPVTSLLLAGGAPLSRRALLVAILGHLESAYEAAESGASPHGAWQERLIWRGERVTVSHLGGGENLPGVFAGTDAQGRLLLRDEHGRVHHIAAGDVSLRGPQQRAG